MSKTEENAPNTGTVTPAPAVDTTESKSGEPKSGDSGRSVGGKAMVGAAVGIGSAAIVAALLYARKRS